MAGKTWQVVLAGTGGQGLIVAGVSLAQAAVLEGKNAVQTQTYGIQSRGGYSHAEVVISHEEILFPKCDKPDLVLTLSQAAYDRFCHKVPEECIILYDRNAVVSKKRLNDVGYPFSARALDLGNEKIVNSLALGAALRLSQVVDKDNLALVLGKELPPKALTLNLLALDLGYEEVTRPQG